MLVWLASFPRSGNHLLRSVLQRSFGLGSYSVYPDRGTGKLAETVGALLHEDETVEAFLDRARASPDLFLVKTHDPVPETDACLYIVRDARAALYSYRRFLADFEKLELSLEDLVAGKAWPGAWQDHVRLLLSRDPKNTLVLRYEELASDAPPVDRIGAFLGVKPIRPFDLRFSDMQALNAKMFSIGQNAPGIASFERDHHEMFWAHCGEMMRALGYRVEEGRSTRRPPITLPLRAGQTDIRPARRWIGRWFSRAGM